ncbi:E3 ubiquitin-protein ligase UHRF1-like [Vanessa atalanta]|uniref:E3 ubiquitin-protein ligase UHRF1-like n=1 Tax=Vanessa atalanta TaxID=42275 RepID=UPI001FCDEF88|nr:E3 ubiquitin-protein ligase UHRF1-like [Vanessa atalanta]
MHVRIRIFGKPDAIVVVESKLTKIDQFRRIIRDKFDVEPKLQRLFYGGKLLEDGYTFHDYNIKLNDVIQLMIRIQPVESLDGEKGSEPQENDEKPGDRTESKEKSYKDTESKLYTVGDLVDMKDRENGAWFEGKVVRIVLDPDVNYESKEKAEESLNTSDISYDKESDVENKPPSDSSEEDTKSKKKGIAKYFTKAAKGKKQTKEIKVEAVKITDDNILYKVQLNADEEDSDLYCQLKEIRPRARREINIKDLKPGQTVMLNHNTDDPLEKGYWYDFKVDEVKKLRINYELVGTLYLGPDSIPQNDTKVRVHDKIFVLEQPVPVAERNNEYSKLISEAPEKRSQPLNCLKCRDDEDSPCKECGCYLCSGKESPEKIVLCDECNNGFHMKCLTPPLTELPEEDWYCPSCKRDPNDVIAPGAAKQTKKGNASKTNRDWGRGMACVGKTKTCAMPPNHFGPIPGIEVGMCWRFRIQLSESGVHRPPVSGIHGRDVEGAYSIVLSGGYEDDVDYGNEFTYTGSGGRDLSGNKRTAEQSCDQTLTRENKALARNCAVKEVSEKGADAREAWQQGKPVRVVRSYKMLKHFPKYAPKEGIRYDGIYKVVKYYPEKGLSGYRVWKYLLRRDDPNPAPWEPGAKQFPIVYPDGYLEAEAEKKALKEKGNKGKGNKKRALRESNRSSSESEASPPLKKRKTQESKKAQENKKKDVANKSLSPKTKIPSMFTKSPKSNKKKKENGLTSDEKKAIESDTLNAKLWGECLDICEKQGKKEFIEHVTQVFLCIICQEVAVSPVTTPCLHNFCMACMKLAFKSNESQSCPCCRHNLSKVELQPNENLKTALRTILTGYDAGKK